MKNRVLIFISITILLITSIRVLGRSDQTNVKKRKLFIVGFSVPGEAVEKEIAPLFSKKWTEKHPGEEIEFQFSWGASGAQARNVILGLDADIVYLSLEPDVRLIEKAGLIHHDWNLENKGIVSKSVIVFRVEPGNPFHIKDWADILKAGVKVLTPNPQTSGGARWNILALYGSILKQGGNVSDAENALRALYGNVVTFGESARASIQDFERGVGQIALTYENEVLWLRKQGKSVEFVIPSSTIYIENPAAVVDTYTDQHGVKDIAQTFLEFLRSEEAQKILAEWGFRSIHARIEEEYRSRFPLLPQAFDIGFLGGWSKVETDLFNPGSLWTKIIQTERKKS
ncbi:MAG: sulfate ABC transporter substrate-binding protein [Chlamydiae bacterium]|nr:sulfate ABC transporter substrate-binding protein [Chlamydiota bacterium]MBI3276303.1 sulfate ABC transporter substrate-binding protein [Chlamydiota bacterium]